MGIRPTIGNRQHFTFSLELLKVLANGERVTIFIFLLFDRLCGDCQTVYSGSWVGREKQGTSI